MRLLIEKHIFGMIFAERERERERERESYNHNLFHVFLFQNSRALLRTMHGYSCL